MRRLKGKLTLFLATSALLISGCSTAQNDDAHVSQQASAAHIETVKPGAAIAISHTKPDAIAAGEFAALSLSFDEAYDEGTMQVKLNPSEGLELFGSISQKSFPMDGTSRHDWPINVRASEEGIYFLSILAVATNQDMSIASQRSFSIRLDVGNITSDMKAKAFPENGTMSRDGSLRILEAKETIK